MSRATQIQQLYIGLLGRAADQDGLDYWTNGDLSVAEIAANIVNEQAEFSYDDREVAINALYQNLFGRAPEPTGLDYWLNESETPTDELLFILMEAAGATDATALSNRTFVANAYTQASAETGNFNKEAAADVIADVDQTTQSVSDALNKIEGLTLNITTGLTELFAAEAALDDFLAEVGDVNGDNVVDRDDVLDANDAAQTALANHAGGASQAHLEAALLNAQNDLAADRSDLADVDGLPAAVDTLLTSQAAFQAALAADEAEFTDLQAEIAKADVLNGTTIALATGLTSGTELAALTTEGDEVITNDGDALIVVGENGQLVAAADVDTATIPGFDALLAEAQEAYAAALAVKPAQESFDEALTAVLELEGVDVDDAGFDLDDYRDATDGTTTTDFEDDAPLTSAVLESEAAVVAAQAVIDQRAELTEAANAAQALEDQLLHLEGAIDNLRDMFDELGYELVDLDGTATAGTAKNDIFLFGGVDNDIDAFGAEGQDRIFFGETYVLVQLEDGQDIATARVGDQNTLEIFWQEVGGDLVLYVESETFAGNAQGAGALADITTITLTGAADLDIAFADGYISVA